MNSCGPSSMMMRRFYCCGSSGSESIPTQKKPLVFFGSPQVSVTVLHALFNAAAAPESLFEFEDCMIWSSKRW